MGYILLDSKGCGTEPGVIQPTRPNDSNLADMLARRAVHDKRGKIASDARVNHSRQVFSAVRTLIALGLMKSVSGSGPRTVQLKVMSEAPHPSGDLPYALPGDNEEVVPIPADFWLKGWIHALTSREIGCWLMFRDLLQRHGVQGPAKRDGSPGDGLRISGADRLSEYDLTRACWDTHQMLTDFGLLTYIADPNRRESGLVIDFESRRLDLEAHRFTFTDEGLQQLGVQTVESKLRSWGARARDLVESRPHEIMPST